MTNNSTDYIRSLAKGLRVLEAFGADHPRLSIAESAAITGLDRATTRRCLLTFHEEGYVDYDGKFFTLTHRAFRLGMGAMASLPLPQIVQPWLDQLTQKIGQSCSVAILDETEIVYVARATQRSVMSIGLMPGSRLPAHSTSMGRVLLASLARDEARAIVERSDLTPRTKYSLTSTEDIMSQIEKAKANSYVVIDQEVELGLRSISVPLMNTRGETVAALNTGMAAHHEHADMLIREFLPHLQSVQSGLARVL